MNKVIASISALVLALIAVILAIALRGSDPATAAAPDPSVPVSVTSGEPSTTAPDATRPVANDPVVLPGDLSEVTSGWLTDWSRSTIDLAELKIGIQARDPRDLIAPIDAPAYETAESADEWLVDREIGVSLNIDGTARFYPLRILTSHEIVNDVTTDGVPFAVTYCPLCNTAVAFDRRIDGQTIRLGVSGLLRNSDLVMWDDATVSLWQQITGEGIVGEFAGSQLTALPTATVSWGDFKANNPDGFSLSINTGFRFNYGANSYVGYSNRTAPFSRFFDADIDERFPALDRVVGVRVGEVAKAYPFAVIDDARVVNDELAGEPLTVWWAPTEAADNFDGVDVGGGEAIGTGIAFLRELDGDLLTFEPLGDDTFRDLETGSTWSLFGAAIDGPLEGSQLELALHQNEFWFAWSAFNPDAPVYGS